MMTFKEKLIVLRKIKHLTQDEFASAVGVSRQAVYKWESGQSYPAVQQLMEMKLLFGISLDDLLDDTYEIELPKKKRKRRSKKADAENADVAAEVIAPAEEKKEEVNPEPVPVEKKEEPKPAPAPVEKKEEPKPAPAPVEKKEEPKPAPAPVEKKEESKPAPAPEAKKVEAEESTRKTPERTSLFERLFGNKK